MIPAQTLVDFPVFSATGTKTAPEAAKYAAGLLPGEVLPAEWMNFFENKSSAGITELNRGVSSMEKELNNIVTAGGGTPAENTNNQVITAIQSLIAAAKAEAILAAHPVGSLYWSSKSTNPGTLFGGAWVQIKDRFIYAKGDSDTVNATGGAKTVVLTIPNLPSHQHWFTPNGGVSSEFTGTRKTGYFTGRPYFRDNTNGALTKEVDGGVFRYYEKLGAETFANVSIGSDQYKADVVTFDYTPTGSVASNFTGTRSQTELTGSGTAVNKMPPYIVKYCWERTA